MRVVGSTGAGWRKNLSDYGATTPPVDPATAPVERRERWQEARAVRRSSHALGWLIALGLGAAVTAFVIANQDDPRTVGKQLDDAIASVRNAGSGAGQALTDSRDVALQASQDAVNGVSTAISDTGISAKVKTALAADPALSASRITVTTHDGIVRLEGPAPDAAAKERATVLAGAPRGVRGVDNRLGLPQPTGVVPVADGMPVKPQVNAAPAQDDASTANRVKTVLATDALLGKARIDVSARQGVVRMDGLVPDTASRDRAAALAAAQPGVKSLDNRLLLVDAAQAALTVR